MLKKHRDIKLMLYVKILQYQNDISMLNQYCHTETVLRY